MPSSDSHAFEQRMQTDSRLHYLIGAGPCEYLLTYDHFWTTMASKHTPGFVMTSTEMMSMHSGRAAGLSAMTVLEVWPG